MAFLLCLPVSSSSFLFQASASLSESLEYKFDSARLLLMEFNGQSNRDGKDHIIQEGNDRNSSSDVDEFDPWTAWLYKPRTVSSLLVGACFLIWASGALNPDSTASNATVSSVRRGVWAMIAVFLIYCVLQAPSTLLIRPHPAVWRFVHGMAVVYLVALTFLLFQNRDDARQFMKYLHPHLGNYLKDLMELIAEFMSQKILKAGIWAGMRTVTYINGKTYKWVGLSCQPNIISKVKRSLGQFTPAWWDKDEWHPMQGPLRFFQVLCLCVAFMTVELNTFFLKFSLWIPQEIPWLCTG
uniref:CDP-diacylglycerol--serine O-phosphatidyltransferase n=1 Tax=Ananas comosus var. bracteatus TaxID=296719 RepID=A0A6V7NYV3_ANACO|nr:unnamed protein product [Ananas comosus var. bracteatus]